ncbi:MAG: hypothetical protein ICV74_01575 [Thermoleophilia bacterium]|nr:hypothetical protein [Thermoleophilia bacterium]
MWASALRPERERERVAVFSPLAEARFALGLETIYEGYLLHFGRPRLFAPESRDTSVLLGDYLYAHGLVRISELEEASVVADLAELLSLCAHLRASRRPGDGAAWASAVATLGGWQRAAGRAGGARAWRQLAERSAGRAPVARALALHAGRISPR